MKKIIIPILVTALISCQPKKSTFQGQLLTLGQDYMNFRSTQTEYGTYKLTHDSILWKARRLACQKKYDTIRAKITDVHEIAETGSYFLSCESNEKLIYKAIVRFKDDIAIKQSPFYQYKLSLKKDDVITIPMYLYEVSSMGIDNSFFEIYFWPIPEGVTDIKAQLQKDLYNTVNGDAYKFESDDCHH